MRDHIKQTPSGGRWLRHPLIDWLAFQQAHGVRMAVKDREGTQPMTECEFILWAQSTKRQTKAAAQVWWKA